MRFFLDNNLAPRFARAIDALLDAPNRAVHLTEKFDTAVMDVVWFGKLAKEGDWVVISGDLRITRNPHERKAWQDSQLTAFFLKKGWLNQTFWLQAAQLVRWWPHIMEQARSVAPGAGFLVPFQYTRRFEQPKLT